MVKKGTERRVVPPEPRGYHNSEIVVRQIGYTLKLDMGLENSDAIGSTVRGGTYV